MCSQEMQSKSDEPIRSRITLGLVAWFFQTLASLFWIASVFVYEDGRGYEAGDVLQLCAAVAWAMSNAAALPSTLELRRAGSPAPSRALGIDAV